MGRGRRGMKGALGHRGAEVGTSVSTNDALESWGAPTPDCAIKYSHAISSSLPEYTLHPLPRSFPLLLLILLAHPTPLTLIYPFRPPNPPILTSHPPPSSQSPSHRRHPHYPNHCFPFPFQAISRNTYLNTPLSLWTFKLLAQ